MIRFDRMRVLTDEGVIDTVVLTDDVASTVGRHWNAINHYRLTGDTGRLAEFEDERINFHRLLTDPDAIDDWERRGDLDDLDSIYADGSE